MKILFAVFGVFALAGGSGMIPIGTGMEEQSVHRDISHKTEKLVFGVFAESDEQLHHAIVLGESIRSFGGRFKDAPVWIYLPEGYPDLPGEIRRKLVLLNLTVHHVAAPEASLKYYYARKVFAAGEAESMAADTADILVWMDEDTIILDEPGEFDLPETVRFAYRPVMHKQFASLFSEPPDEFWRRLYQRLNIPENRIFAMTTPADKKTIRAYFNAGLLVVRPEKQMLRKWGDCFIALYNDAFFVEQAETDIKKKIFLHQTALVGAVLNTFTRSEIQELPGTYNYPMFFKRMFGATQEFATIQGAVTLRYDYYFRNPEPDWDKELQGPRDRIQWIKSRLDP